MPERCPFCGSSELVTSAARGDTICGNPACGELLEERNMVTEVSFVQTGSGAATACGGRVVFHAGMQFAGGAATSRELAIDRGLSKLCNIADRLQLSTQIQEAGRRMYQLAVQMNFGVGRPTNLVACACLYVVCRRSQSPHLLIDFSDVLQKPVKSLGRVYMRLLRRLVGGDPAHPPAIGDASIEVPLVDPSIFIERFSRRMNFGNMQRKIQNTAMRLIQYMHRDWICTGRRPNGLCGAALMIASFYHGFNCSPKDIADVVRMSEGTLMTRLIEMKQTPLALMSREEFERKDPKTALEDQPLLALPPCFVRSRKESREALLDAQRLAALPDSPASSSVAPAAEASRSAAEDAEAMPPPPVPKIARMKKYAKDLPLEDGIASEAASTHGPDEGALVPLDQSSADRYTKREPTTEDIQAIAREISSHHSIEAILEGRVDPVASGKVEELVAGKPGFAPESDKKDDAVPSVDPGDGESLSDVDDEALEKYLLDAEEQQHKSDIWHEVNKDYLEEWHVRGVEAKRRKLDRQARQESAASASDAKSTSEGGGDSASENAGSSSRRSRRRQSLGSASSCTQSAMMALAKKNKVSSNRINIEALESLFS
eukprot:TRINITY_DN59532_c0_g1_i1.p1 TRINITY_DN59532_c0_g1~~TRINITY_DN59532_c0_g1_i1.p1  ORF type:complete len:602 (+),score=92.61 TRINITY_DN59532_c0_g1_i1:36-1841(+)